MSCDSVEDFRWNAHGIVTVGRLINVVDSPTHKQQSTLSANSHPDLSDGERDAWFSVLAESVAAAGAAEGLPQVRGSRHIRVEADVDRAALAALVLLNGVPSGWQPQEVAA